MSNKILRTALVGAGGIAKSYHLKNIASHSDKFELCGIMDINEQALAELKEKYNVPTYTVLADMLAEVKPDLCVIASPTFCHVPQAIECMEAGCDVFPEKPMGMSLAESQKLYDTYKKLGKKLMIYQPHRTRAETLAAQAIIASGKLGEIFMLKRENSMFYLRDHWQGFKKNGGGNHANHGAHYIDQLMYLSQTTAVSAEAHLPALITTGDADDMTKAIIKTDKGIVLDIDINFVSAYNKNSLQIYGKFGSAEYGTGPDCMNCYKVKYYDPAEHDGNNKVFPFKEEFVPLSDYPAIDFYEKCYEYYALDMPQFVPVEDTLKVMAAIDMCRASSGEY